MESLGLLVGHLLGDYILQNDWMARCKVAADPGPCPTMKDCASALTPAAALNMRRESWLAKIRDWDQAPFACTVHCLLYTLAVWACSFWWMPWWGLVACFLAHWPLDRWKLARRLMAVNGQESFATGPLAPWSVVVVDNTLHLLTLFLIGVIAGA